MISTRLARELRDAGLGWTPASGDAFQIDGGEFEGDVFTISDLTVEAAIAKLGFLLDRGCRGGELRSLMGRNLVGECR